MKTTTFMPSLGTVLFIVLSLLSLPALAADASAKATTASLPPEPSKADVKQQLISAYEREYAFLVEQKTQLQQKLSQYRSESARELRQLKDSIAALQQQLLNTRAQQRQAKADLAELQESNRNRVSVEAATGRLLASAGALLGQYGIELPATDNNAQAINQAFTRAQQLLAEQSRIRVEQGRFFDAQGVKVNGELIKVGGIAAFGISPKAKGVLAPAGGGEYKLWATPASAKVAALAKGEAPALMPLYLYESLDEAADAPDSKTALEHIASGGVVAWIIFAVGITTLLFILARVFLLWRAATPAKAMQRHEQELGQLLAQNRTDDALALCKQIKGAAGAVLTTTVRHIAREREQLENLVNETLLQQRSRLDRYGSLIMVIATVAPLLGLLGTVVGIITTFEIITQVGTGDPTRLAGGIAIALVNTELGLAVAIPALLIGSMLTGWAERIKDRTLKSALRLINQRDVRQPEFTLQSGAA